MNPRTPPNGRFDSRRQPEISPGSTPAARPPAEAPQPAEEESARQVDELYDVAPSPHEDLDRRLWREDEGRVR